MIPEDKFIKDLISKLPKSKAAGQLSPYQLKADAWKARVGAVVDPLTVEDLTTELQKLYMTMYPTRKMMKKKMRKKSRVRRLWQRTTVDK